MAKGDIKVAKNGVRMIDTGKVGFGQWKFIGKAANTGTIQTKAPTTQPAFNKGLSSIKGKKK